MNVRRAVASCAAWHVPLALLIAAACLVAGINLPLLVVREFFFYGQKLSIIDGVRALFDDGDWALATILALFSIVLPLVKILALLALWWRSRLGQPPRRWLVRALEASGRWAMLDVFLVALVIVQIKAHVFVEGHVAAAVYPFLAAIALIAYAARAISRAQQQPSR